ncbi:MAG: sensor histidine kinase [Tuberibacillus sp.]
MRSWFHIIPKNTGLSIYVWIIFCLLPFYFIIRTASFLNIILGIFMIIIFFLAYLLSFNSKSGAVYVWVSFEMAISIFSTLYFGYVYFALFLAFFIGNIRRLGGFLTLYIVHLVTTIAAVTFGFFIETSLFLSQLPFVLVSIIGVILLPFNMFNRNRREVLETQLEDANKRISQLMVMEERQRIARDLHDTLGQKLSLIGLKSDLAARLLHVNPESAENEINDINQTARSALKEVREMVSDMKGAKLDEEIARVEQILKAAEIDFNIQGDLQLRDIPLLVENVLCMCLKEAVTNVVKHSGATFCQISIQQTTKEVVIEVYDNGSGLPDRSDFKGNGLIGMEERLEFVNGRLDIVSLKGTKIIIRVPQVIQHTKKEERK